MIPVRDMMNVINALASVAQEWSDPDHAPRAQAVEETLDLDNRFTEEAITFAVNQQMSLLTLPALTAWQKVLGQEGTRGAEETRHGKTLGVLNPGNIPMVELQDFTAALLAGFSYAGTASSRSAVLFPAFADAVSNAVSGSEASPLIRLGTFNDVLSVADALIASGSDETMTVVRTRAEEAGIAPEAMWIRGHRTSVAILDGGEDEEERLDLAEDALLHEGLGCRNASLVFAPDNLEPDPLLDAFATFRGLFPSHPGTSGSLKMQQAFLAAINAPHAWADGLPFLLSKGDPEPQSPGHIRWTSYGSPDVIVEWMAAHGHTVQCVYARRGRTEVWAERLSREVEPIGTAQRPSLDWCPDGRSHQDFFSML